MTEFVKLEMNDEKKEENTSRDSSSRWMYFDYKYMNEWFPGQHSLLKVCCVNFSVFRVLLCNYQSLLCKLKVHYL
jgi:hypothetical protein